MSTKKPVIIDVRDAKEFENGHAKNSMNIPLPELENHLDEIKKIKDPIVMVCGGGTRNGKAQKFLEENGIESAAGGSWRNW